MSNFRSVLKHILFSILIFIVLVIWNIDLAYGFSSGGLLGLIYLTILLVLLPTSIISLLLKKIKRFFISGLYLFFVVFSLFFSRSLERNMALKSEARGNIVVEALEKYKEDSAFYPKELSVLVPQYLNAIPKPTIGILSQQEFHYTSYEFRGEDSYGLSFLRPFFSSSSYSPSRRKWLWD